MQIKNYQRGTSDGYEYKNGRSAIIRAKKMRGGKCQLCGWDKATIDGHHKIAPQDGGKHILDNIILVCPNCHRMIHEYKITI